MGECYRALVGLNACPVSLPHRPEDWCPACQGALEEQRPAGEVQTGSAPCPLDDSQITAYADWLAAGDQPAWSWQQVLLAMPN